MVKQLGKGAEAELLECLFMGEPAVCKRRVRKRYRVHALDDALRTGRTRAEARILHAAKQAGVPCPLVKHVDLVKKEIFLNKINGTILAEKTSFPSVLKKAGECLARLHDAGIVHGDSTTSNFMVDGKGGVWLIDFGLSEFSVSLEDQATDVLLFKKSVAQKQYGVFKKAYASRKKHAASVFKRLDEIESRGRYVVRSIAK